MAARNLHHVRRELGVRLSNQVTKNTKGYDPDTLLVTEPRRRALADIRRRDGDNCYLCHEPLNLSKAHIEHIIPKCRGGSDKLHNRALSCPTCNLRKHDLIVAFTTADRRPVFLLP